MRPIDSHDIYLPIINYINNDSRDVKQIVLSTYQWLFPGSEKDLCLERFANKVFHKESSNDNILLVLDKIIKEYKVDIVVCQLDQPGLFQELLFHAKKKGAKIFVINESPLTLIQAGETELILSQKKSMCFDDPSRIYSGNITSIIEQAFTDILQIIKFVLKATIKKFRRKNILRKIQYRGQSGADVVCVIGEKDKRLLNHLGIKSETIKVVGWLRTENLIAENLLSRVDILSKLSFTKNDKYVVLVSQSFSYSSVPVDYDEISELIYVVKVINKYKPKFKYVLTVHPAVNEAFIKEKILAELTDNDIIIKVSKGFDDRLGLLKNSELVVGYFSTALMDAMIAEKPIVTLDYVPLQLWYPFYVEYGAVCPVFYKYDATDQIQRILSDQKYIETLLQNQKYLLKDVLNYPEGNVLENVTSLLISQLDEVLG